MSLFMLLLVKLLHIVADLAMLLEPHSMQTNINVMYSIHLESLSYSKMLLLVDMQYKNL